MEMKRQEVRDERYALGDFGDARLKKRQRNCMSGWWARSKFVCGNWVGIVRERFALAGFWLIRA
ncbi:hypothetical protein [Hydrogenophaga sp.]|uniref:hypothetical protein n=1 Tax=Hydrogenophaga sp. TaxID=1904254 RepID=UPI0025C1CEC4|nr:hypothetical protein [Hydrogenophaga sp.]